VNILSRARNGAHWARHGAISFRSPQAGVSTSSRTGQQGQVLVLFAIFLTVIMGTVALVLDQGILRKANMDLTNALDAGALAGVPMVLDDPAAAEAAARQYVQLNYPGGLPDSDVNVSFRCLIGTKDGLPRLTDVPLACDPGSGASWTVSGDIAYATCDPATGDVCNTIVLSGPASVDYTFGRVVGVDSGSTGARSAAACKGACGEPPQVPIDLVMIIDRTSSMNGVDTDNARNAADSVRTSLDPQLQWLALGALGPSKVGAFCKTQADTAIGTATTGDLRRWVPIGLTGAGASFGSSYSSSSDPMAQAISCFGNSSTGTDLADPVRMATYELQTYGRSNSKKAILLLSDGQPNRSTSSTTQYCKESEQAATAAKSQGIEVFTVGFGLDGANDIKCPDSNGPWYNKTATTLLATMATNSANDAGCPGTENSDGDHYFCLPKTSGASTDLAQVFQVAVQTLTGHSRLVDVD
jgi:hypothetical protein